MSIQHRNIPDAELHEPKGVSTAGANTHYVANGAGSGSWAKTQSTELQGLSGDGGSNNQRIITNGTNGFQLKTDSAYGGMQVTGNTNAFSITAAADPTLNTTTDYVLYTGTGAPWAADPVNFGVVFNTNRLTVPVNGVYKLDFWSTIVGWPSTSTKISVRYRINGGTFSNRHPMARSPAVATDPGEITGFGLISLNANDFLQIYVASSVTGNIVFQDVNTALTLVRAL